MDRRKAGFDYRQRSAEDHELVAEIERLEGELEVVYRRRLVRMGTQRRLEWSTRMIAAYWGVSQPAIHGQLRKLDG